jgi:cell division protein FtsI/penicillin-binding protein 2
MGKVITPTFRAEYRDQAGWHSIAWNARAGSTPQTVHGSPTEANAEKLRRTLNKSFQPTGVNAHVAKVRGYIPHVSRVRVIRQSTGQIMAEAVAPMFEAV